MPTDGATEQVPLPPSGEFEPKPSDQPGIQPTAEQPYGDFFTSEKETNNTKNQPDDDYSDNQKDEQYSAYEDLSNFKSRSGGDTPPSNDYQDPSDKYNNRNGKTGSSYYERYEKDSLGYPGYPSNSRNDGQGGF